MAAPAAAQQSRYNLMRRQNIKIAFNIRPQDIISSQRFINYLIVKMITTIIFVVHYKLSLQNTDKTVTRETKCIILLSLW